MAQEYLLWFAYEHHWTEQQVITEHSWLAIARLSLAADDVMSQRKSQADKARDQERQMRRMA